MVIGQLIPEMSSLQVLQLTGVDGRTVQAEEMEALFGKFNKPVPLYKLTLSNFNITGCLSPLTKSFQFFPNLGELELERLDMDERDQCCLLKGSLCFGNVMALRIQVKPQGLTHCHLSKSSRLRDDKVELNLDGITLTPAVAAALGQSLPELLSLLELEITGADGSSLQDKEMEALFGGFNRTLPLCKLTFSRFSVTGGCLAALTKSLCFFPSLRELKIENLNMDESDHCNLLENIRFISNLTALKVEEKDQDSPTTVLNTVTSQTSGQIYQVDKRLNLDGINLTPEAAAALGRSLPEMLFLRELELTGLNGSALQAEEIEALFGGFNKTVALQKLTFRGFSVQGGLASLTQSFRFFPDLRELNLEGLSMDDHNLFGLLRSLTFISNLKTLSITGKPTSEAHCCTAEVNTIATIAHKTLEKLCLDGIRLTQATAATLGRSLPEMLSLEELELTGVDGSTLEGEEMEAMFEGLNKALVLSKLTFIGFHVTGCLAPLTKSFRFFPKLRELRLEKLNMDEHDICSLLENLKFMPTLKGLRVRAEHLGQARCYTTDLQSDRANDELNLGGINLTPAVATALSRSLPEMLSLQELEISGYYESILQGEEMEALFGGFNKTMPLHKLSFSVFSETNYLAPLTNSLRFFPKLSELKIETENMSEHDQCYLLDNFGFFRELTALRVQGKFWTSIFHYTTKLDKVGSFTSGKVEKSLNLDGIRLTPGVTVALGRALPEMSSLEKLELTGGHRSILQTKEMEALFGGFNKTVPLTKLTFSGYSVTGCLAPLTRNIRFFPNLRELELEKLNLDEHDQCGLLENFGLFRNLTKLSVRGKTRGSFSFHYCTSELDTQGSRTSRQVDTSLNMDEISLTPAVAAALGRSLPKMSSLETLTLASPDGIILQAGEMEALFGGFNKTLPVYEITFSGFSVRGCLSPFTNMLHFVPNLRKLNLVKLDIDEDDLCGLLNAHYCTSEAVNVMASITHESLEKLCLSGISLTQATAAALGQSLPKMKSLQELELSGLDGSNLQAEEMEALFGRLNKTLPLQKLNFSNFSVTGCLTSLTKSLRLFPNLEELKLEKLNLDESDQCSLVENLRFIRNLTTLDVQEKKGGSAFCFLDTTRYYYPDSLISRTLRVGEISLTPAVVAVLGRLLPKMSLLESLKLTGMNKSALHVEEIETLFGGFNKSLSLYYLCELTLSGFSVTGCLAPLIRSLQFFPRLTNLTLEKLNMDEHDVRYLVASFQFFPGLSRLNLSHNPLGHAVRYLVPHIINLQKLQLLWIEQTGYSEEDLNYVRDAIRQALPELTIC